MAGAGAAWALDHQIGGDGIFYDCGRGVVWTTVVGIVCLIVTALCGFASFRLWRRDAETSARQFVALVGFLFALLLALAILLSTIAGFILPECLT